MELTLDANSVVCTEFNNAVTQLFSLKYLSTFSKACSFCPKVELRLSDQQPLVIRFPLPRMSDNLIDDDNKDGYGILLFFLAPKIEDNAVATE
jgi:DNA polymerase III sliding clamp (beta) subunit (PCNA family)